jgi:hypothetical protein
VSAPDPLESEDQPPAIKYPVDPALLQKAVMRMRNAARGNGINPHTILLNGFDGETLNFVARSLFEIVPTIAEKHMPGRETHGIVCTSESDMQSKIKQAVETTTVDKTIVQAATVFLEHRKDKGFAVDNLVIKLDRLNKVFIFYNSCTQCHGSGRYNCMQCQGVGRENCPKCDAHRTIVCPVCRGTRVSRQKNGQTGTCIKCLGQGEAPCTHCQRSGKIRCRPCSGSGLVPCPKCAASGIISDIAHVSFVGKTRFLYDKDALPEGVPALIDEIGPAMVAEAHGDIVILKEKLQKAAQDEYRTTEYVDEFDELVVPFDVGLPWGALGVRIGREELTGTLFGMHPLLLDYAPFLEKPVASGLDRLNQAAAKHGRVRGNLEEAIRFRAIGDALILAATKSPKKAALAMRGRWTLGFRPEVTDMMVAQAAKAFGNIATLPRMLGLLAGLVFTGGFLASWLVGPLRGMAQDHLTPFGFPVIAMGAVDILVVAFGGYLAATLSQLAVRQITLGIFRKVLPEDKARKVVPRAGTSGVVAYIGAVAIFAAMLGAAWMDGHTLPEWVDFLMRYIPR